MTAQVTKVSRSHVRRRALLATKICSGDSARAIECFYPPDDGGDGLKTIIWLEQKDLIELKEVRPEKGDGEDRTPVN